ncbi:MAG: hypothetical protein UV74_C0001G0116 [Candidatus Woesebacteria bacterium GW2011_GWB1_43_14]|uniref:Tetratricopeptide repeat protein n=1 Tax=Candidatus Woesebacteria bacterium GW2011_GWB1_43_14 TaxID=1618578 RepID=A0A0G1FVI1_9BACT|nr:MAG: hypothetical protein UT21_C0007G0008 [Candidatus Woesebacteria bacterium GW2011_GWA1_39_11b]KKS78269.1 MAG: hypothetical protein UV51_C0002G0105 [Candidatus Woesebacteria bacterium GW2011_GWC1_42_9]KKS99006.1 MAG: hypothetical protein UV74_C0001G0116 [Candidatus Woesebacteria bacterium GW2011_GWB1_43_14]
MKHLPNHHLFAITFAVLIIALSVGNAATLLNKQTGAETYSLLTDELNYWKRVVYTHPDYRDGYLEIAKIEMALGNTNEAENYLKIAEIENPNSEKVKNFENILGVSTRTP